MMRLVLHVCCAPCLAGTWDAFAGEGDALGFFHNPNIHPLLEFRKRLKAVQVLADRERLPVRVDDEYGLRAFLAAVGDDGEDRCRVCYQTRLARTARLAADEGADAFSTTMLVSRHQKHELLREVGEQVADAAGVAFLYRDLRDRANDGPAIAKRLSLYRQQYCGCIFSEYERFKDTRVEVYRGP
jgi:hypothetical protein